jgi:hypothetical protein
MQALPSPRAWVRGCAPVVHLACPPPPPQQPCTTVQPGTVGQACTARWQVGDPARFVGKPGVCHFRACTGQALCRTRCEACVALDVRRVSHSMWLSYCLRGRRNSSPRSLPWRPPATAHSAQARAPCLLLHSKLSMDLAHGGKPPPPPWPSSGRLVQPAPPPPTPGAVPACTF